MQVAVRLLDDDAVEQRHADRPGDLGGEGEREAAEHREPAEPAFDAALLEAT